MRFESSDCAFGIIAPVHIGGHQLVWFVPLFLDGSEVFCAGFIVQYLLIHDMAVLFGLSTDVVLCGDTVAIMIGA